MMMHIINFKAILKNIFGNIRFMKHSLVLAVGKGILGTILTVSGAVLLYIRYCSRNGNWFRWFDRRLKIRRWYCPGKYESDQILAEIQENLCRVSVNSIGSILSYPTFQASTPSERRKEFSNKVILEIKYRDEIVGFHMGFLSNYPHAHVGLVSISSELLVITLSLNFHRNR